MKHARQLVVMLAVMGSAAFGQAPANTASQTAVNGFDQMTKAELDSRAADLLKEAQASPSGSATVTLQKYPGHFTMLTVRTRPGGAELHEHAADIFIVLSGEATEVTGGTIADSKSPSPGEFRGSRVVGGTEHLMRTGDVIHIAPGTPHQTVVAPGKTFTYFVIKVAQ